MGETPDQKQRRLRALAESLRDQAAKNKTPALNETADLVEKVVNDERDRN